MAKARDVARFFIDLAQKRAEHHLDDRMTNLRLQKMLYFAQGWSLARNGKPLFEEPIEAWPYGPVVPEVYHEYAWAGAQGLSEKNEVSRDWFTDEEYALLLDVAQRYAEYSMSSLVNLSHAQEGPWNGKNRSEVIGREEIKRYFETLPALPDYDALIAQRVPVLEAKTAEDGAAILPAEMNDVEEWDEYN